MATSPPPRAHHTTLYYYAAKTLSPDALVATAASGRVRLTWQDRSADESGFLVERTTGGSTEFTVVGEVGPKATKFEAMGVPAVGQVWKYRVRARTAEGSSTFSAETVLAGPVR